MAQQTDQTLSFLQTGFWVFLALAVVFFVVTIALFFAFDIVNIFKLRTGLAQKKTVKQMNERGRKAKSASQKFYGIGFTDEAKTEKNIQNSEKPVVEDTMVLRRAKPMQTADDISLEDTVVLAGQGNGLPEDGEYTTVLAQKFPILPLDEDTLAPECQEPLWESEFEVVKETLLVYSEENVDKKETTI